ncbi:hypothetical protein CSB69_4032 [Morganella morganii]|nr:hypothetical protein CSB69_4032 [Morganella morganii]EMP51324.1 hypothetical protein C790_01239 [Morganella morganii SC01]
MSERIENSLWQVIEVSLSFVRGICCDTDSDAGCGADIEVLLSD